MARDTEYAEHYARLSSSRPIDARAAAGMGHGVPDIDIRVPAHIAHWDAPPQVAPLPRGKIDKTGQKRGRLTVVGFRRKRKGMLVWLVRCICGRYEERRSSAIENDANSSDACFRCVIIAERIRNQKRQSHFEKFGVWPPD